MLSAMLWAAIGSTSLVPLAKARAMGDEPAACTPKSWGILAIHPKSSSCRRPWCTAVMMLPSPTET